MEDFLLPVGVGITQQSSSLGFLSVIAVDEFTILIGIEYIECLLLHRVGHVSVIAHLWSCTLASFLCSDDDDTIRTTATIDGGGRSILQYGEALDVVRIDHRQCIGRTLDTLTVEGQSVDDNQRVVGGIE